MVGCKIITTCATLEKPHCGISKGILACLTLHQMQYWKRIRKQTRGINDLKIIGTKKETKNQNY